MLGENTRLKHLSESCMSFSYNFMPSSNALQFIIAKPFILVFVEDNLKSPLLGLSDVFADSLIVSPILPLLRINL